MIHCDSNRFAGMARALRRRRVERTITTINIVLAASTLAYFGGQLLRPYF